MAKLLAMQQQMAQQNQSAAPSQENTDGQPDMAAMMAELQTLRAQVASQNQPQPPEQSNGPETEQQPKLEAIIKEFGQVEENEA